MICGSKSFEAQAAEQPFSDIAFEPLSPYEHLAIYDALSRVLQVNERHPFISKIIAHSKNRTPATLVATSEVLTDAFLRVSGIDDDLALQFYEFREKALRLLAGQQELDASQILRQLNIADQDKDALESAVGQAFRVLGFEYEKRGRNRGGTDGLLEARLGRIGKDVADYRLVYDAKTTIGSSIPIDKVNFAAILSFKKQERARVRLLHWQALRWSGTGGEPAQPAHQAAGGGGPPGVGPAHR